MEQQQPKRFIVTYQTHLSGRTETVIVTAKPYATAHNPSDLWYATAPGAGCSKNYPSPAAAVRELVYDDLGYVLSIVEIP